jgi:DNA-binding response OmpR family regulator
MKKILVIEDEEDFQHLIGQILDEKDFEVSYAADGREGLETVKSRVPDLVLLDINLPHLNGLEVLKRIRNDSDSAVRDVLIIMLTVRRKDEDQIKGLDIGADDYITKPFRPDELLSRMNAVLKRGKKKS